MKTQPIGKLKASKNVYCTICSQSMKRNVSVAIFNNSTEEIANAKEEIKLKLNLDYTCKICKSILKDVA